MNLTARFCFLAIIVNLFFLVGCENPSAMNASTPNVKHITQGEFAAEVTLCTNPVVLEFYATWCGPCRQLGPMLDRLASPFTDKVKFVKVNIDESPGLAQNYSVQGVPTVIFFKDGKLADRLVGLPLETDLKARLENFVAGK
jgi:thioredoxin 1